MRKHEEAPKRCPCNISSKKRPYEYCAVVSQINKDVNRTMSAFDVDESKQYGDIPVESGHNPIYNLLTAYSEIDMGVGYT